MNDYKLTLNLPETRFPMKAGLPAREPAMLTEWEEIELYKKIREWAKGREPFVLHDGPPYANGDIHLGHVINKVLKDITIKSKTLSGFDAPFIPGWDCHGLPIEHKVEQKVGKAGSKVDRQTFRKKCREYAQKQVEGQRKEFRRLGVFADWDNPYLTMDYCYEADTIRSLAKVIENGHLQRGYKPVYWSVVGQSALAEAEVEYQDKTSTSVYVRYPVLDRQPILNAFSVENDTVAKQPLSVVIWTTTPWTLPSSQAVALGADVDYSLVRCETAKRVELLIVATSLVSSLMEKLDIATYKTLGTAQGALLEKLVVEHPFYNKCLPLVLGEHVTVDSGTGCVHTAPDHGVDDFYTGKKYDLGTLNLVDDAGVFREGVEYFAGSHVYKVDENVVTVLEEKGRLLLRESIRHSYPHCWRTKTPLIYRATPQWFISMDKNHLLERCQKAVEKIKFTPDWGRHRMEGMLSGSPDWCISRQRTWGVPAVLFVHKETGEPHPEITSLMEKIAKKVEREGIEAGFSIEVSDLLPPEDAASWVKVTDTLDVWFDSGVSHQAVIRRRGLPYPADLYFEGSDQHRGWFQSSLKTGVAIEGQAPYKRLITHGFTVDEKGHKMSKSLGNGIAPKEVISQLGGDVLRLWVSSVDYSTDMTVSKEILKRTSEAYRRIRNTARFMLANLSGFSPEKHKLDNAMLLPLDAWAVNCAYCLQKEIVAAYEAYNYSTVYQKLHNFCVNDLGGFYLDVIKDRQYTTQADSQARRSCQTALYHIMEAFVRWIAPILSFTAEEIWKELAGDRAESVHMTLWYEHLDVKMDPSLDHGFWAEILKVRECCNKALEASRKEGVIGSALEAEVTLYVDENLQKVLDRLKNELRFVLITSGARLKSLKEAPENASETEMKNLKVAVAASKHKKCSRCWHRREDTGHSQAHPDLCERCVENVFGAGEKRLFA